jgi:tetratricopeptide (TPR) repeat protein
MTSDERTESEARADRALRRGELSSALALYQAIADAFPDDDVVAQKLSGIRENLQPHELSSVKTRAPTEASPAPSGSVQEAEALAAKGDYAGAIAIYRRAVAERPDSDLFKERLAELFQLAQSMAPRNTPAPMPRAVAAPPIDRSVPPRNTDSDAPVSSPRLLSDLLDQISRRRRGGPPKG